MRRLATIQPFGPSRVEVPLVGGLGNQLFIYAFGLALSLSDAFKVTLLQTNSSIGNNTHGVKLLDQLELPPSLVSIKQSGRFRRLSYGLGRRLPFQDHRATCYVDGNQFPSHDDLIRELNKRSAVYRLNGYFQSPDSLRSLQASGLLLNVTPKSPSNWYIDQLRRISRGKRVGLHIRRGDTLSAMGHGVLSMRFYEEALRVIGNEKDSEPVLVFSDDPRSVFCELASMRSPLKFEIVSPPSDASVAESLSLMSMCSSLIIGNSTFSWWAANTGIKGKRVVSPSLWSPGGKAPIAPVNPANWLDLPPDWLS